MTRALGLDSLRPLGRSAFRVSPLALGTATFGLKWGRGMDIAEARQIFDAYVDRGGNFIDTAMSSPGGNAEHFVGLAAAGKRDRLVIAAKYTATARQRGPTDGGNQRSRMMKSVEQSLRRLATDRIDLLYLQTRDGAVPPEEAMEGLDDLVRSGKVIHGAIADAPAWRVAEMQIVADLRGWAPLIALRAEYSLVQRKLEHDLVPMANALDLGIIAWSPLAGGLLAGAHTRASISEATLSAAWIRGGRTDPDATQSRLTDRTLAIADTVRGIAIECGATSSQVALAWTLSNPAVAAPVLSVSTLQQLEDNLGTFGVALDYKHRMRLEAVSAVEPPFPDSLLARPTIVNRILNGLRLDARSA
jgi:aryl-alcohol dehydrogenase-like predicted oxidoreductase